MKNFLLWSLKFVLAWSGPFVGLYAINLFEKYHEAGKQVPDSVYTVLIRQGTLGRYITEAQYLEIRILLAIGVVWIVGLFVTIYITKFRK
jgi:hypothetical protein